DAISGTIQEQKLPVIDRIPIVTMRVESLKGVSVDEIRKDSTSQVSGWILSHEFRVTYRDSIIGSENLVEGEWFPAVPETGAVPISVSADFAERAGVGIGDGVT